ncbi:nucleoside 2-deoxyribosyltransferase [Anaerosalibacter bizertensis]|uniref:Nucleoside 2-deoxyribosyltransferase n=1 Tax=Anaerosalibacter bizertensis TaxID=932217 RepID=A0A844FK66_9FIRM|nr:nucleoside 2-deoxyribosyltransferase [Anaerosalibacter bizertensis]MBU5293521.1 nucleoside 2-deoxyribosyltransferase [Anaerosalibacter bizertensis]MSS44322.1 nucleoside 2-deoxyribosyltransferase [Anaerosalibacter bizertensis]
MKGYFASHFFNDAMFRWTEEVASYIESETGINMYVPQRNGEINDKRENDDIITDIKIAQADTLELKKANILFACLDGLTIDDGVAGEIMGFGLIKEMEEEYNIPDRKPRLIIGIITDMRWQGTGDNHLYRNLMILGKVKEHGYIVEGYPGEDDYKEKIIAIVKNFEEKYF